MKYVKKSGHGEEWVNPFILIPCFQITVANSNDKKSFKVD
jgi:hypothetical protein